MTFKKILPILVLSAAVGCNSATSQKPQKTGKQEMNEQWNAARAGVLGSLASEQFKGGNLPKARESADNALKLNPKNPNLHLLSAKIAMEQGMLDQAEKELRLVQ